MSSRVFLRINMRNILREEDVMEGGTARINRILRQLFDYQRFERNRTLQQVIDFIRARYTDPGTADEGGYRTNESGTVTERE